MKSVLSSLVAYNMKKKSLDVNSSNVTRLLYGALKTVTPVSQKTL